MNLSRKYARSLHAQISLGTTSDDRFMPDGYVRAFAEMEELILTEKLDGQNNCFNKKGVFARSHVATSVLPWDKPMRERWQLIKNDLNDLEIFGENMYGIHTIAYHKLESYFYVFAVREGDRWLSWEEVKFYAAMLDFPTVPEIPIKVSLQEIWTENRHQYQQKNKNENKSENELLALWLTKNLGLPWEESVTTSGLLGGYEPSSGKAASEGFVVRNSKGFATNEGAIKVAPNEFNNLFKLVRAAHVKTDEHWTKNWQAASLINYQKYAWHGYEYISEK